jgi:tetratricopeptide (TPR) repeat protein
MQGPNRRSKPRTSTGDPRWTARTRWIKRAAAIAACALPCACAAPAPPRAPSAVELLGEARADGLAIEDPLAIDDEMKAAVDEAVSRVAPEDARLNALLRYLNDSTSLSFEYVPNHSLTARRAFRERRGDCMAYTNLFIGLSRYLDLETYFVHVREVRNYYEKDGSFFTSSHVAVGHGQGKEAMIFDLSNEISNWKLALYQAIDDSAAVALHYNNVAVSQMVAGKTREAERLFSFWLARKPEVAELHNNFGVLLNRTGRHDEALRVLAAGMSRFPTYEPLYTNAIEAARGAKRPDVAAQLEQRGREIERNDPFFLFARALNLYRDDHYAQAADQFERARDAKPDSPIILAWLTRAYLQAGRREQGIEAFLRVKEMAPEARVLRELEAQFPELRGARSN